ncbi:MAG: SPFH domain-containing protein [Candidatus Azambacteria bacterium]|nr:SPFH domain-containing protein [Candidatus Azambacteria bacterium]
MVFENVDADEIVCVQDWGDGELHWHVDAGIKWQGFGKVTTYKKLADHEFDAPVMFNDNGTGKLIGTYQVELPLDIQHLTSLHTKFNSQESIEKSLVQATVDKVVYMTGPLMSSKESSAERKTDLIRFIADQLDNGVFRTTQKITTVEDQMSKEKRTVTVAEISLDKDGKPERQESSVLATYGIKIVNFAPRNLDYDETVKKQIADQQKITMEVQTARAHALEAEQRRITAEADGKAAVMTAQYQEEEKKIRALVGAEQRKGVASLERDTAEFTRQKLILEGQGEAEKKRLIMAADGALEKKLDTYEKVMARFAQEFGKHRLVPDIQMGGSTSGNDNAAANLINLLTTKTAKDLALDMKIHK